MKDSSRHLANPDMLIAPDMAGAIKRRDHQVLETTTSRWTTWSRHCKARSRVERRPWATKTADPTARTLVRGAIRSSSLSTSPELRPVVESE